MSVELMDTTADFWLTHCWARRFSDQTESPVCGKPATWQGPQNSESTFVRAWRACDAHHQPTDEPIR